MFTRSEIDFTTLTVLPIYYARSVEIFVVCLLIRLLIVRVQFIDEKIADHLKFMKRRCLGLSDEQVRMEVKNLNNTQRTLKNLKMRELAEAYNIIGETCIKINEVFNFKILMTIISTFLIVIVSIWTSLYYFKNNLRLDIVIRIIISCAIEILNIGILCSYCELLVLSQKHIKIIVNEIIMNYNLCNILRNEAKMFMYLLDIWPLQIFIYGMVQVDIKLMLKFISVATTYLVVAIQISRLI
ncbi:uncharacterized protein [Epargyreus clarus]|uniref:uncharacterized protein n=1 Tax=Epargyreus clarus TaxID=520877 RepID=UPI003C3036E2